MKNEKKEPWMELCELASNEMDSAKLHELIVEIDRMLNQKYDRRDRHDEVLMRPNFQ